MDQDMADVVDALTVQHGELANLLDGAAGDDWQRPSRCAGWSVADVVVHLAQTDELALASLEDRVDEAMSTLAGAGAAAGSVDEAADSAVRGERGTPGDEVRARWRTSAEQLRAALAACDPHRRVTWIAGRLSARTLATTRLSEAWIHTGDIAPAFGVDLAPTDALRHIARLAWRTLPYAFAGAGRQLAGPVAVHLRAPSGAAWDFVPDDAAVTTIRGDAVEFCLVAARRVEPAATSLEGDGPDVAAVLDLVRTYA